jgi:hypothetical protein
VRIGVGGPGGGAGGPGGWSADAVGAAGDGINSAMQAIAATLAYISGAKPFVVKTVSRQTDRYAVRPICHATSQTTAAAIAGRGMGSR